MKNMSFIFAAVAASFLTTLQAQQPVTGNKVEGSDTQVKEEQPDAFNRFLRSMQEANTPAILIREENLGYVKFNEPYYTKDAGEYPVRLILGRIVQSSTPKYKSGTLVFLSIGERVEKETPYWLVNLEGSEPKELAKDGSVLYCFGEAHYAWNGKLLLQNKQYLNGIWKQMAEEVEKN